jgi:hypothetical protein
LPLRITHGRLVLGDFLFTDIRVDPIHDQIRNLIAVLVIHNHVTVAKDAYVRRVQHLSIAADSIDASDERLAIAKYAGEIDDDTHALIEERRPWVSSKLPPKAPN